VSATLTNTNYTATPINGIEVIQQAQATVTFGQLTFCVRRNSEVRHGNNQFRWG